VCSVVPVPDVPESVLAIDYNSIRKLGLPLSVSPAESMVTKHIFLKLRVWFY
jgi:hypothetical protein